MRSPFAICLITVALASALAPRQSAEPQASTPPSPQTAPADSPAPDLVFRGEVERGKPFDYDIDRRLVFHLDPDPDVGSGWSISIFKKGDVADPPDDYVSVATPPYHFFNQRYLSTAYGYTAKEAVALTPRHFYFVESPADYKVADHEVNINLFPNHATSDEIDDADAQAAKIHVGRGEFLILDSRITPATVKDDRGTIDWIKFEVRLTFHSGLSFRKVFARG